MDIMASEDGCMSTPSHTAEEEEMSGSEGEEGDAERFYKASLSARSVTLAMLVSDGILSVGENVLTLDYLGQKFTADLLPGGKIRCPQSAEVYHTPSAWAVYCKRLVNPAKKTGCGWSSIKYRGRKLEYWKSLWMRKQRAGSPYASSPSSFGGENGFFGENGGRVNTPKLLEEMRAELSTPEASLSSLSQAAHISSALSITNGSATHTAQPFYTLVSGVEQEEALNLSMSGPFGPPGQPPRPCFEVSKSSLPTETRTPCTLSYEPRTIRSYASLGRHSTDVDPNSLVQCERFCDNAITQPFTVSVTTNAMIVMDFHCHLTSSEVVGYLGGTWDSHSSQMSIVRAYPVCCRLGDKDKAPTAEEEIKRSMQREGLWVVGWYHSHPRCQPQPSLKDIDCQMSYQASMKGQRGKIFPVLGFIVSPYEDEKKESEFQAYWVMPPPEQHTSDYWVPMHMQYTIKQNPAFTEDVLKEIKKMCDFYLGSADQLQYQNKWVDSITYLDKLKMSLSCRLPQDQMDHAPFLNLVQQLLVRIK